MAEQQPHEDFTFHDPDSRFAKEFNGAYNQALEEIQQTLPETTQSTAPRQDDASGRTAEARKSLWLAKQETQIKRWRTEFETHDTANQATSDDEPVLEVSEPSMHNGTSGLHSSNSTASAPERPAAMALTENGGPEGTKVEPRWKAATKKLVHRAGGIIRKHSSKARIEESLPDLRPKNLELLSDAGKVGAALLPYYEYALRIAPELSTVSVIRNDAELPLAHPEFTNGRHSVQIPLSPESPGTLRDKISKGGLAHIAKSLGMMPEELAQRPDLLHIHAGMHELGHTVQYKQYEDDPEAFYARRQRDIDALPIPGQNRIDVLRATLKDEDSSQSIWVRDSWTALQQRYGVQSIDDVIDAQSRAKRNMFHERYADEFAIKVIRGVERKRAVVS